MELTTSPRYGVYIAGVIERSAQRRALHDGTGETVSDEAWVVVQNTRSGLRRPSRVRLLGLSEIAAMRERYVAVVHGRVGRPAPARTPSQCDHCAHKARCGAKYQDRA